MKPLHRKLVRDLWSIVGQVVSIAMVIACGVAIFVGMRITRESLEKTRDSYYARSLYSQIFAHLERAPKSLEEALLRIPGIDRLETRIAVDVTLNVRGLREPAIGRFISVPDHDGPKLNRLHMREGRLPDPTREGEVVVSEGFALQHHVRPGATVRAVINGRLRQLKVVGIALSAEYIFQIRPGEAVPDEKRYGIFWIAENQIAASFEMEGSFNDVVATLSHGATERQVIERLDDLLGPYGGLGTHGRHDEISHRLLTEEIRQLSNQSRIVPTLFLLVSAILLNLILSRLIALQREQIAALRAFGYTQNEVLRHYLEFVTLIVLLGVIPGTIFGVWIAKKLTQLYTKFYHFPFLELHIDPMIPVKAFLISIASGIAGAMNILYRASRLPPAQAMRPEAPESYQPTWVERLGLEEFLSMASRMVLRNIERRPFRAFFTCLGIAMSVGILVVGGFMVDAIDLIITREYTACHREDVNVTFLRPSAPAALFAVKNLPGVLRAEPYRTVAVRARYGARERLGVIHGILPESEMLRPANDLGVARNFVPPEGLLISRALGDLLGAREGDELEIEVLVGKRGAYRLRIGGMINDLQGFWMYMDLGSLQSILGEGGRISGALLQIDSNRRDDLYDQLKDTPLVATVAIKAATVESFRATIAENLLILRTVNIFFAGVMAIGVAYSVARISLSERSRELATLRVLGFTRTEISVVLLGELTVIILTSLPAGMLLGYVFTAILVANLDTEILRIPLAIQPRTYGFAVAVVLVASFVSGLVVRRLLDRLDLIAVLKERD